MKIYTQTGDRGKTSLFSGERVAKSHIRVEAYGDVDELNATIGTLIAEMANETHGEVVKELLRVQSDLFHVGALLATAPDSPSMADLEGIGSAKIAGLEDAIDRMTDITGPLVGFILPGGSRTAAWSHIARTVCRRSERHVIGMLDEIGNGTIPDVYQSVVVYLNRLSDYLFALARFCNHLENTQDVLWEKK